MWKPHRAGLGTGAQVQGRERKWECDRGRGGHRGESWGRVGRGGMGPDYRTGNQGLEAGKADESLNSIYEDVAAGRISSGRDQKGPGDALAR